jgi:hypothetical protein
MSSNLIPTEVRETKNQDKYLEISQFVERLKNGIWIFGIPSWLFGLSDRSLAAFADGYISTIEVFQLFTASFFLLSWIYLRPENMLEASPEAEYICPYQISGQSKGLDLKERHMISQEYTLPYSYLCQIYHLLNLKHLETVHKFSLNNLRVVNVSEFQATNIGGVLKFETILESPYNPLRIWRQPVVEVNLTLHTPYTVELSIPVYNSKRITVFFSAIPVLENQHKFFIDIYSDLDWPKPILQVILHFASCLTLYEDLPYLKNLQQTNVERLFCPHRTSGQDTMLLFNRFVELYVRKSESTKLLEEGNG